MATKIKTYLDPSFGIALDYAIGQNLPPINHRTSKNKGVYTESHIVVQWRKTTTENYFRKLAQKRSFFAVENSEVLGKYRVILARCFFALTSNLDKIRT